MSGLNHVFEMAIILGLFSFNKLPKESFLAVILCAFNSNRVRGGLTLVDSEYEDKWLEHASEGGL